MKSDHEIFTAALIRIVGKANVLTKMKATAAYCTGFRTGAGYALAVVRPRTLVEMWRVLEACVQARKIVIVQAANTGLTGGSTPDGDDYDRDVVIINTLKLSKIHVIDDGRQVICLPGATLHELENILDPLGREPHSVIGSSCLGASVLGGICNNSGGALLRRGPAYTQMALFARVDGAGRLDLVNHLEVNLGNPNAPGTPDAPEQLLDRLEHGRFTPQDITQENEHRASDHDYIHRIRNVDADTPLRFNADRGRLFEASGCAGKVVVFAVRLDTFPKETDTRVFYLGTSDPTEFAVLRRHVLSSFQNLPVLGEYLHRDMFDIADRYGKDAFLTIQHLGTRRLPKLFAAKRTMDAALSRLRLQRWLSSDQIFQAVSHLFPDHLPPRLRAWRRRFDHHLILKMSGPGIEEARTHLRTRFPTATADFFECTEKEATKALLHRFVAAGAAIRYRAIHPKEVEDIVALDIALPPNNPDWFEVLPQDVRDRIHAALYYGHFFCYVFHQDYIVRKGVDTNAVKARLWQLLDQRRAEYPAEHNVGHAYRAKPALADFYRTLDPCNQFNPGIGQTSKHADWREGRQRGIASRDGAT